MTSSLKRFRMQTFRDKILDESLSGSDDDDPEDNRSASIKRRHRKELEQAERENRENTSALLELRDMDDELSTMRTLFAEQQATIETMQAQYEAPELRDQTENGRRFLAEALDRLEDYKRQTGDMIDRVETTRKDVRTSVFYSIYLPTQVRTAGNWNGVSFSISRLLYPFFFSSPYLETT